MDKLKGIVLPPTAQELGPYAFEQSTIEEPLDLSNKKINISDKYNDEPDDNEAR